MFDVFPLCFGIGHRFRRRPLTSPRITPPMPSSGTPDDAQTWGVTGLEAKRKGTRTTHSVAGSSPAQPLNDTAGVAWYKVVEQRSLTCLPRDQSVGGRTDARIVQDQTAGGTRGCCHTPQRLPRPKPVSAGSQGCDPRSSFVAVRKLRRNPRRVDA